MYLLNSAVFHKLCIDPWLLKESRKCPNCKGRVLFPNERGRYSYSSDSEEGGEGETSSGDERTPLLCSRENYRFIETLTESQNTRTSPHFPSEVENNSRTRNGDRYHQYLEDEDPSQEAQVAVVQPFREKVIKSKVTFAPAVSVMSSASPSINSGGGNRNRNKLSSNKATSSTTANAFVLPMGGSTTIQTMTPVQGGSSSTKKSALKSPLRRLVINQSPTTVSASTSSQGKSSLVLPPLQPSTLSKDELSPCSSTSSDKTLIDFYDIPPHEMDTPEFDPCPRRPLAESREASLSASESSFHSCVAFESEFPSLDGPSGGGTYGSFQSSSSGTST